MWASGRAETEASPALLSPAGQAGGGPLGPWQEALGCSPPLPPLHRLPASVSSRGLALGPCPPRLCPAPSNVWPLLWPPSGPLGFVHQHDQLASVRNRSTPPGTLEPSSRVSRPQREWDPRVQSSGSLSCGPSGLGRQEESQPREPLCGGNYQLHKLRVSPAWGLRRLWTRSGRNTSSLGRGN